VSHHYNGRQVRPAPHAGRRYFVDNVRIDGNMVAPRTCTTTGLVERVISHVGSLAGVVATPVAEAEEYSPATLQTCPVRLGELKKTRKLLTNRTNQRLEPSHALSLTTPR